MLTLWEYPACPREWLLLQVTGWRGGRRAFARGTTLRLFLHADGEGAVIPLWARCLVAVSHR